MEKFEIKEWQLADALRIIDCAMDEIDDGISYSLQDAVGLDKVRRDMGAVFEQLLDLTEELYPDSKLPKDYGLL